MFSLDDTIPENFKDKIGIILKKITAIETNTKKKKEHVCDSIESQFFLSIIISQTSNS